MDVKNQIKKKPTSVNEKTFSPIREGLFSGNFAFAKFGENKTLAKIFEFTVTSIVSLQKYDLSGRSSELLPGYSPVALTPSSPKQDGCIFLSSNQRTRKSISVL